MLTHLGIFPVIQPGTTQTFIAELETQRMDKVQSAACIGTQAYDIAGIRRDLRLIQNNMEHSLETNPDD